MRLQVLLRNAIPLDLPPRVPPSDLTMKNLSEDKIGKGGHDKLFNKFCTSLKHWKDRFFLIDRRAIPNAMLRRHQDSSVADHPPIGVQTKDIRRLCENIINLRPVHPTMLYEIGLTTIWKHVGHRPAFKDGGGTVATSMFQFLKFLMSGGIRVGKGTALAANEAIAQHTTQPMPSETQTPKKYDYQKVVEHEDERVLAAKRKSQAAKDKAGGKRPAAEQASRRTKKKKTIPLSFALSIPLSFALSESEVDDSNRSGSGTHNSASPLNTIIPPDVDPTTGEGGLAIESVSRAKDDMGHSFNNVEYDAEVNSPLSEHSPRPQHSTHSDEDVHAHSGRDILHHDEGGHVVSSSSGGSGRQVDGDSKSTMDAIRNQNILADNLRILQQEHQGCVGKEAGLVEKLAMVEKEKDDLLDREAQLSIAAGWSEDVKVEHFEEDAEAILAAAIDYDPECKATFMSEFDSLFTKSYPYVEKLVGSFRLPLGDLQNKWLEGEGPTVGSSAANEEFVSFLIFVIGETLFITWPLALGFIWDILRFGKHSSLGHWRLDSSGTYCIPKIFVTWPLALGLIRNVLRFEKHSSLGHWRLDSSGTYYVSGNIRHLAIGAWTHPECTEFREIFIIWPLALGLIRNVLRLFVTSPLALGLIRGIMGMEPDIENMMLNEYLEYKAAKERQLWDNVRSRRSPTNYDKADFDSFHRIRVVRLTIRQDIVQDSICEQNVDSEEDQEEDGDDGDMRDIKVEDVERIRQLITPNFPDVMDDIIQPLIPKTIHVTPPNEDYVAPTTKSILDYLLEEFEDEILNVTMVDEVAECSPNKHLEELEILLTKDSQSHYTKNQGNNSEETKFKVISTCNYVVMLLQQLWHNQHRHFKSGLVGYHAKDDDGIFVITDVARRSRLGAWLKACRFFIIPIESRGVFRSNSTLIFNFHFLNVQ
nr:hypothetical protein [Tanacetum cinerariifolium]